MVGVTSMPAAHAPHRLSRAAGDGRPAAPVRIVHLGLGNFFRAHQAWYTEHAPDADAWGIAAFTGRSPGLAAVMERQGGLYTLVTQRADGDAYEVVSSVSAVHAVADHDAWLDRLRTPGVALITLTVTEAGYARGGDGSLDVRRPDVADDVRALRVDPTAAVRTVPARLAAGLLARRAVGGGPLSVVPCDNLSDNGPVAARVVRDLAALVDPTLTEWIDANVAFVTTMVDRITPRPTGELERAVLAATEREDAAPVATEPFTEWVLAGEFAAGRPRWDAAGARFVEDIAPFEQRKLWLLNGAHSLLAYAGSLRGHETVADAIADPVCRAWVEEWWDEAARWLTLPAQELAAYRAALLARFTNPRIRHLLAQIAADGSLKLPVRVLPALRRERAAGRVPPGAVRILAAWVCHLRGSGAPVVDPAAEALTGLAGGAGRDAVRAVLGRLDRALATDDALVRAVIAAADVLVRS
jgi:fructuronate reductase